MSGELMLAVAGFNTVASLAQGQAAAQSSAFQAAQLRREAGHAQEEAAVAARDQENDAARLAARLRAHFGGAGTAFEGTPLQILSDQIAFGALEAARLRAGGARRAAGLESDARLTRFRGRVQRQQSFFNAGTTLLTGLARAEDEGLFGPEKSSR